MNDFNPIENFNSLPDTSYVRLPTVKALFGVSRSTIYHWIKSGYFPKPHQLGKRVSAWTAADIRQKLSEIAQIHKQP